jgi:alcohol dehydrogenase class IV
MRLIAPVMPNTARVIAAALGAPVTDSDSGERLGDIIADSIRRLMRRVEIKSLKELGYSRESVVAFAAEVSSNHLSDFCPLTVTEDVSRTLLERVYDTYQ